jgi:hypothetical protein
MDHKPLEWLVIVFDAYKRRGRWINMLQDFGFKIVHHMSSKHINVDVLSKNLVDGADDDNFQKEI